MQLKCKKCGVDLYVDENQTTVVCDCCGLEQTVLHSHGDDNHILELSSEANNYRLQNRFDEAITLYKHLIEEYPDDCELKWCLLLCEYGITYVDDKKTQRKIPTCNRTINQSIYNTSNYKYIMEHATLEEKQIYESEAKLIDDIQKNILKLAQNHERYDIFICYKETDNNNKRTKDSQYASLIYEQLRSYGYKIFYAKETLKNKVGQQYEPIIYSALRSAKVMLVLGTKVEYIESPWVRNEWSRFLEFKNDDPSKNIAVCIGFDNPYDLPEELRGLQSTSLNQLDYKEQIARTINSFFGHKTNINVSHSSRKEKDDVEISEESLNSVRLNIAFGNFENAKKTLLKMVNKDFKNVIIWDLFVETLLQGKTSYNDFAYKALVQLLKNSNEEQKIKYKEKYKFLLKSDDFDNEIDFETSQKQPGSIVSPVKPIKPVPKVEPIRTNASFPTPKVSYKNNEQATSLTSDEIARKEALLEQIRLKRENKFALIPSDILYKKGLEYYNKLEYSKAVEVFKRAARKNYTKAIVKLAECLYYGNGVSQDKNKALDLYYEMAIRGNAQAQNKLAQCYDEGLEIEKSPEKAFLFYQKAANQNDSDAQRNLAYCYKLGKGVNQNLKQAIKWLIESAKQEDSISQNSLGYCFEKGFLVPKDYKEALHWYQKAAEKNDDNAECNLALLYYNGKGIPQSYEKAAYWLMKASDKQNPIADYYLAILYRDGKIGGNINLLKAINLLKRSALNGYVLAQYNLGLAYEKGNGVEQDIDSAYYWYHKASIQNYKPAVDALLRIES